MSLYQQQEDSEKKQKYPPLSEFSSSHWMTRLATISDPNLFHGNFLVKSSFLWGHDLTKNILQVCLHMQSSKLVVIATTYEPGFRILCMSFGLVLAA